MAKVRTYEGTWDEIAAHANEFRAHQHLKLIVPDEQGGGRYRPELTPAQRIRLLDELAAKNRSLPVLPPEAFDRESLYADNEELS